MSDLNNNLQQNPSQEDSKPEYNKNQNKKPSYRGWLYFAMVLILVIVVLGALDKFGVFKSPEQKQQQKVEEFLAETGPWYAVFLTNGQVYFGKLENVESQYPVLRDIYYLQIQQQVQPQPPVPNQGGEGETQVIPAPQPQPPRLTLIKFGTELHRPKDYMRINRDHILYWQELSSDSQVVQAIARYKEEQNNQ